MKTVYYTIGTNQRPLGEKIVDFTRYRTQMQREHFSQSGKEAVHRRRLRRHLELLCLGLEACVCLPLVILVLTASVKIFL